MAQLPSYLPSLSAFDPRDSDEGTLDPLGLSQLATRIADQLVPGFTERVRRPRFLTALALGAWVLNRREYEGGTYGNEPDGPAYLAWERLLVESFARRDRGDPGFIGIPGIGKARDAASDDVRLSSRLHLKNPAAVGLWVAYKAIAVDTGVLDANGNVGEAGSELLNAWAAGIGQPELMRGKEAEPLIRDLDGALEPLMGRAAPKWNPKRTWDFHTARYIRAAPANRKPPY